MPGRNWVKFAICSDAVEKLHDSPYHLDMSLCTNRRNSCSITTFHYTCCLYMRFLELLAIDPITAVLP